MKCNTFAFNHSFILINLATNCFGSYTLNNFKTWHNQRKLNDKCWTICIRSYRKLKIPSISL